MSFFKALPAAALLFLPSSAVTVHSLSVVPSSGKAEVVIGVNAAVDVQDFTLDAPARVDLRDDLVAGVYIPDHARQAVRLQTDEQRQTGQRDSGRDQTDAVREMKAACQHGHDGCDEQENRAGVEAQSHGSDQLSVSDQ